MSAVKLTTLPAVRHRLEMTEEELQELKHALSMAAVHAQSGVERDQKQVDEFTQRLADSDATGGMKEHYTRMLQSWQGHLQRDQKELERFKAVMDFVWKAQVIQPRRRR